MLATWASERSIIISALFYCETLLPSCNNASDLSSMPVLHNYRPCWLNTGKMLGAIIKDKIAGKVIRISQHSFAKGKSGLRKLSELFEEVTYAVGTGEISECTMLCFPKAFEKMLH